MPTTPPSGVPLKKAPRRPEPHGERIVADAPLARYNDLAPSLNRIMARPRRGRAPRHPALQTRWAWPATRCGTGNAIAAGRLHDHPVESAGYRRASKV
jgi:hypothetical protein